MAAIDGQYPEAIETAQQMFQDWRLTNYTVPPNLRHVVYSAGVR